MLLGVVFAVSGAAKLRSWGRFRDTLSASELLPARLVDPLARLLPPLELVLGVLTLAGFQVWTTPALIALLGVFTLGLAIYRIRGGVEIVCGCFADFERRDRTSLVLGRNLLLLLVAVHLGSGPVARPAEPLNWLAGASCVVSGFLLWMLAVHTMETWTELRAR